MVKSMKKQEHIQKMANIICSMENKPSLCKDCPGKRGGCFSIPKAELLYAAGCRLPEQGTVIITQQELDEIRESEYDRGYDAGKEFQSWYDLSAD